MDELDERVIEVDVSFLCTPSKNPSGRKSLNSVGSPLSGNSGLSTEEKLARADSRREAQLSAKKDRASMSSERVRQVQEKQDAQAAEMRENLEEKIKAAAERREELLRRQSACAGATVLYAKEVHLNNLAAQEACREEKFMRFDDKLEQATKRRELALDQKAQAARFTCERVADVLGREEEDKSERLLSLECRLADAEQQRLDNLEHVRGKAAVVNAKVEGAKLVQQAEREEKLQKIQEDLQAAAERREQFLENTKTQKAKEQNSLVDRKKQEESEKSQTELEKISLKLEQAALRREEHVDLIKLKADTSKVSESLAKVEKNLSEKKAELEDKMASASQKREQEILLKVEKAQHFSQRVSDSKAQETAEAEQALQSLENKLSLASERREQHLSEIKGKAEAVTVKLQTSKENLDKAQELRRKSLEDRLQRADERRSSLLREKENSGKKAAASPQESEAEEAERKKKKMQDRLDAAEKNRRQSLDNKVRSAHKSAEKIAQSRERFQQVQSTKLEDLNRKMQMAEMAKQEQIASVQDKAFFENAKVSEKREGRATLQESIKHSAIVQQAARQSHARKLREMQEEERKEKAVQALQRVEAVQQKAQQKKEAQAKSIADKLAAAQQNKDKLVKKVQKKALETTNKVAVAAAKKLDEMQEQTQDQRAQLESRLMEAQKNREAFLQEVASRAAAEAAKVEQAHAVLDLKCNEQRRETELRLAFASEMREGICLDKQARAAQFTARACKAQENATHKSEQIKLVAAQKIEDKQKKANALRTELLHERQQKSQIHADKVRRSSLLAEQKAQRLLLETQRKLEVAANQRDCINAQKVSNQKKRSEKISKRIQNQRTVEMEDIKFRSTLDSERLSKASLARMAEIDKKKQKAEEASRKVAEAATRSTNQQDQDRVALSDKINTKLSEANVRRSSLLDETAQKAKAETYKVAQKLTTYIDEQEENLKNKALRLEHRLEKASERRGAILESKSSPTKRVVLA